MNITSIRFVRSATVNLGNYENMRAEVEATVEVKDGDHEAAYDKLRDWVEEKVRMQIGRISAQYKKDSS